MRIRLKVVFLSLAALLILVVLGGITAIGWQVVFGPDARPVTDRKFEVTQAKLDRGRYLAEGPAACFHCHTDHDTTRPEYPIIQDKKGAGWVMPIEELNYIAARNITPDVETGIGSWSDDEIARAIREGIRKDGTALFPVMPYMEFSKLDDADVEAIVVYLRTLRPVRNQVPARNLPFPLEHIVKIMPKPITQPQPSHPSATPEQRGEYLATIASCAGCHSLHDSQGQPIAGMAFSGGNEFKDPYAKRSFFTPNLTPDPSGIAHYDESRFLQTLRTGSVGGRTLNHFMPFEFFKNMTDEDLRDIFAYLRAQTPVRHRISNTEPPTMCAVCGHAHGLGELNTKTQ